MHDVIIAGGGLAGLTTACLLAQRGFRTLLIEQGRYPQHRVCGEYVSHEVNVLLLELGVDLAALGASRIRRLQWWTAKPQVFESELGGGGFGISRYALDAALAVRAKALGVELWEGEEVARIRWQTDHFEVRAAGRDLVARMAIASYGKRSKLDRKLGRASFARRSGYVAVKRHYAGEFPPDLVALFGIPGGYCGVSCVENGRVNVCFLTSAMLLRSNPSIEALEHAVFGANRALSARLARLTPVTQPLVVGQLDFGSKTLIEEHVLMVGDAAGLIHPLCGNGMSMALQAASFAAEACGDVLSGRLTRPLAERTYEQTWRRAFRTRRMFGRCMQPVLEHSGLSEVVCRVANWLPGVAQGALQLSHGRAF